MAVPLLNKNGKPLDPGKQSTATSNSGGGDLGFGTVFGPLLGNVVSGIGGALWDAISGGDSKPAAPPTPPPPPKEFVGFQRVKPPEPATSQVLDTGSSTRPQDPAIRIAALEQLKSRLGA